MTITLGGFLTQAVLATLADAQSYQRGVKYLDDGRVRVLRTDGKALQAVVDGTHAYRVRWWIDAEEAQADEFAMDALRFQCDCPVGRGAWCCKHCVAVALAWLAADQGVGRNKKVGRAKAAVQRGKDLETYVHGLDPEALQELVLEQAARDETFWELLQHRALLAGSEGGDPEALQQIIDRATDAGDFTDYWQAPEYCARLEEVLDRLQDLIAEETPHVVDALEHFITRLGENLSHIDDSDGEVGQLAARATELHAEACRKTKTDSVRLAKRLFTWQTGPGQDLFYEATHWYTDLLGSRGIAAYRRLIEQALVKAVTKATDQRDDTMAWVTRMHLESLLESTLHLDNQP